MGVQRNPFWKVGGRTIFIIQRMIDESPKKTGGFDQILGEDCGMIFLPYAINVGL